MTESHDACAYLMIDGAEAMEILQQYFLQDESPEYRPLLLGIDDDAICQSPFVIQMSETTRPYLNWISQEYPGSSFAYISRQLLDQQLSFWQSLLVVSTEQRSQMGFRFYDGTVARQLLQHATQAELDDIFQPCERLYFQQDDNLWYRSGHSKSASMEHKLNFPEKTPWLVLSNRTIEALNNPGNACKQWLLDVLWQHYPQRLQHMTHTELETLVNRSLAACDDHGIRSLQAISVFTGLSLECRPDFYRHPTIESIFLEEKSKPADQAQPWGERALQRLRQEISPALWQQMMA